MMKLSNVEIDLIRAIMYIGRDERRYLNKPSSSKDFDGNTDYEDETEEEEILDPIKLVASYYKSIQGEPKDIAVDHMLEKVPFPEYLRDGLLILKL